jgi:hypothetical protein
VKRKIFIITIIVFLCFAGWVYHLFTQRRAGLNDVKADISLSAVELYNQYQSDETAANKKYLDKVVEVKGEVTDIQKTDSTLSVELKGGDLGGINCGLADIIDGKDLPKKGNTITVKGKCSGYLMDVNLVDCLIEK